MIGFKSKISRSSKRRKRKKGVKRKYIRYTVFAIISYIVFLIVTLPASVGFSFIKNNPQLNRQIQFSSVSGTVWSGSASSVRISGINIGQLDWNLKLLPLLLGELGVYIKVKNQQVSASTVSGAGSLAVSVFGNIKVDNFSARFPIDLLAPVLYGLPVRFGGDVNMHINSLSIEKGSRFNLKSRIVVSKARLVSPQHIEYGDILIQASPQLSGSQFVLTDQGGPLVLNGIVKLKGNGLYSINLGLDARNSASKDLRAGLGFLGRRDASGKYRYQSKGKLTNW